MTPAHANPTPGMELPVNLVGANKGDVWTGYEWVRPERYEELRKEPHSTLPPIQPVPGLCQSPALPVDDRTFYAGGGITGHGDPMLSEPLASRGMVQGRMEGNAPDISNLPRETPSQRDGYPDRMRIEEAIASILDVVDPDPDRGGLDETPTRAAKAWEFWTSGYKANPADVLKTFEDGAQGCDEMVVVRDIPVYSKCEHHLADIFGYATVAYIPNGRIVGLSKLNRLVDIFARRLQVQERLTNQIAEALMEHLAPHGCGVVIKARHMCMESRGVQQNSHTVTSALRGVFKDDPTVRAEFFALGREVRNA